MGRREQNEQHIPPLGRSLEALATALDVSPRDNTNGKSAIAWTRSDTDRLSELPVLIHTRGLRG